MAGPFRAAERLPGILIFLSTYLLLDGRPLRIVVVGEEYGHDPSLVDCDARYRMIVVDSGQKERFKAEDGHESRNPHMRGTTSALRLLFGKGLGTDYHSEFVTIGDKRVHLFDAFALVNYLLCSATEGDTSRGRPTTTMLENCRGHFREAMRILEPTVVIVQGKKIWPWVEAAFDSVRPQYKDKYKDTVYRARLGAGEAFVAAFTHPSAYGDDNWGANEKRRCLLQTVKPSLEYIRGQLGSGR